MKIPIYQIDTFTDKVFGGNPAAVCPLEAWLPDETLQQIALENNLAETAFFIKTGAGQYHLRWFTPEIEMDLCGHATLATAFVIFSHYEPKRKTLTFDSLSGQLVVRKAGDFLELDFPSRPPLPATLPKIISKSLNIQPIEVWKARDYVLLYEDEASIRQLTPDVAQLNQINLDPGGIVVTAQGDQVDFVSRFFTPQATIFEDPVTGSAHCSLIPFWANRLQKQAFHALQLSARQGELFCNIVNDRVQIRGKAVEYLKGAIRI
ncbi:MAG: PhzF family phenazine biosynthesis protein [Flammeovirgaceae bacterium]